jgi:hypothetical protein
MKYTAKDKKHLLGIRARLERLGMEIEYIQDYEMPPTTLPEHKYIFRSEIPYDMEPIDYIYKVTKISHVKIVLVNDIIITAH